MTEIRSSWWIVSTHTLKQTRLKFINDEISTVHTKQRLDCGRNPFKFLINITPKWWPNSDPFWTI